jgi:hypothetical protein
MRTTICLLLVTSNLITTRELHHRRGHIRLCLVQGLQDRVQRLGQEGVSTRIPPGLIRILNTTTHKTGPVFLPIEFAPPQVSRKTLTLPTKTPDWQPRPTLELIAFQVAAAPCHCRNKTCLCKNPGREAETKWISTARMTSLILPATTRPFVLLLRIGVPNVIIANDHTAGVWTLVKITGSFHHESRRFHPISTVNRFTLTSFIHPFVQSLFHWRRFY